MPGFFSQLTKSLGHSLYTIGGQVAQSTLADLKSKIGGQPPIELTAKPQGGFVIQPTPTILAIQDSLSYLAKGSTALSDKISTLTNEHLSIIASQVSPTEGRYNDVTLTDALKKVARTEGAKAIIKAATETATALTDTAASLAATAQQTATTLTDTATSLASTAQQTATDLANTATSTAKAKTAALQDTAVQITTKLTNEIHSEVGRILKKAELTAEETYAAHQALVQEVKATIAPKTVKPEGVKKVSLDPNIVHQTTHHTLLDAFLKVTEGILEAAPIFVSTIPVVGPMAAAAAEIATTPSPQTKEKNGNAGLDLKLEEGVSDFVADTMHTLMTSGCTHVASITFAEPQKPIIVKPLPPHELLQTGLNAAARTLFESHHGSLDKSSTTTGEGSGFGEEDDSMQ